MFIHKLEMRCQEILHHHLEITTSCYALSAMASSPRGLEDTRDLFHATELENVPPDGHNQVMDEVMLDRMNER
jgi:hypothetical protein